MIKRQFLFWHSWAIGLTLLFLMIQYLIPALKVHYWMSIWTLLLFSVLSILQYVVALKFIDHQNRQLFGSFIMLGTFLKIVFAVVLVFLYYKMTQATDRYFIIPFFVIYFIFTVFETIFLVKINLYGSKK